MNSHVHAYCPGNTVTETLSALHLLRSYRLFAANSDLYRYERAYPGQCEINEVNSLAVNDPLTTESLCTTFSIPGNLFQRPFLGSAPPLMRSVDLPERLIAKNGTETLVSRQFVGNTNITSISRRPRSEKKPIPEEQKDDKYYERRKRNNQAAKKSRDARKIREDHIALKASLLEQENAILRAQIITLREEAQSLRHMLIKQQVGRMEPTECSLSSLTTMARCSSTYSIPTHSLGHA